MGCDARTEARYYPIFQIRCAVGVGSNTISTFFDDIFIVEFLKVLLEWIRNEFAVKVYSRITRLNAPIFSHQGSNKMIDVSVRRVKRMTPDVKYAAADLEGAAQSAYLAFALEKAFLARIVARQGQPRWAGTND